MKAHERSVNRANGTFRRMIGPEPRTVENNDHARRLILSGIFTEGESDVMFVLDDEVRAHGCCDLSVGEIAARAARSTTTVRKALREAHERGFFTVQGSCGGDRKRPPAK
jgi:hypothetical protein